MKTPDLNERRTAIYAGLTASLDGLSSVLKDYVSGFSSEDFYSFSDVDKRLKQYKDDYILLVANMAPHYSAICALAASISTLFIEADRVADDCAESLEKAFEEYARFERVTDSFSNEVQRLLNGPDISASALVFQAERLISATAALKSCLE
jgi:hypothetical protein